MCQLIGLPGAPLCPVLCHAEGCVCVCVCVSVCLCRETLGGRSWGFREDGRRVLWAKQSGKAPWGKDLNAMCAFGLEDWKLLPDSPQ